MESVSLENNEEARSSDKIKAWAPAVAKAMAETLSDKSACKDKDDGEHKCASDPQPANLCAASRCRTATPNIPRLLLRRKRMIAP